MDILNHLFDPNVLSPFAHAFSGNMYVSGIIMILLNAGTSHLMRDLTPITDRVFSVVWMRRLVLFAIFFTAIRHLWISILLTLIFTLFIDVLFNENSSYCLIPYDWRVRRHEPTLLASNDTVEPFVSERNGYTSFTNQQQPIDRRSRFINNLARWRLSRGIGEGVHV